MDSYLTFLSVSVSFTFSSFKTNLNEFKPSHDKTNKMTCAPSEDSDPPSLTRVFAVRMKKASVLSYPLSAQRRR